MNRKIGGESMKCGFRVVAWALASTCLPATAATWTVGVELTLDPSQTYNQNGVTLPSTKTLTYQSDNCSSVFGGTYTCTNYGPKPGQAITYTGDYATYEQVANNPNFKDDLPTNTSAQTIFRNTADPANAGKGYQAQTLYFSLNGPFQGSPSSNSQFLVSDVNQYGSPGYSENQAYFEQQRHTFQLSVSGDLVLNGNKWDVISGTTGGSLFYYDQNGVGNSTTSGTYKVTGVTVDIPDSLPPTVKQLAQISADTYSPFPSQVGAYKAIKTFYGTNGFLAEVYQSNGQIVFSVRGTDPKTPKDLIADAGVALGQGNAVLTSYVQQAVSALKQVSELYPGQNITLTGHSLGGGIAELLGRASGLDAVGFDAPGLRQLYASLSPYLSTVSGLGDGGILSNYRLFNDPISQVGEQLGQVITVGTGEVFSVHDLLSSASLAAHSIDELAARIAPGSRIDDGFTGNDLGGILANVILPIADARLDGALTFSSLVIGGVATLLDPSAGFSSYFLSRDPSSPQYSVLTLPELAGVASYRVRYSVNGVWTDFFSAMALTDLNVLSGTTEIEYDLLDQNGLLILAHDDFNIALSFAASGTFFGLLRQVAIPGLSPGVPEPSSWLMMLCGFGGIGVTMRLTRRRRRFFRAGDRSS